MNGKRGPCGWLWSKDLAGGWPTGDAVLLFLGGLPRTLIPASSEKVLLLIHTGALRMQRTAWKGGKSFGRRKEFAVRNET